LGGGSAAHATPRGYSTPGTATCFTWAQCTCLLIHGTAWCVLCWLLQAEALHAVVLGHKALAAWHLYIEAAFRKKDANARAAVLLQRQRQASAVTSWRRAAAACQEGRAAGCRALQAIAGKLQLWLLAAALRGWQVTRGGGVRWG
jgi:hypothetical protein